MKIPNSNTYETIEKEPNIDFSNKHLKVTFSFDEESVNNLPKVSDDNLKTGNEKYCILLGDIDQQNNEQVKII